MEDILCVKIIDNWKVIVLVYFGVDGDRDGFILCDELRLLLEKYCFFVFDDYFEL